MAEQPPEVPDDHTILALSIEAALLPDWYDRLIEVAHPLFVRAAVIEKPDAWIVRIQMPKANLPAFQQGLTEAWAAFIAQRREEGRWEEDEG